MTEPVEQPELLPGMVRATVKASQAKARATRARKAAEAAITDVDPVARVLVDVPLAHLDRPFDYAVPVTMAEAARPGVRVKVRFAGQDVDGYVVARAAGSDHPGRLAPLRRVVSPEPVLAPRVAELTADVAERYAGTRSDVLRLAVPPRHAATEKQPSRVLDDAQRQGCLDGAVAAWADPAHAAASPPRLHDGGSPRAVWTPPPGADWPLLLAHAAIAAGSALICLPDRRDVDRVSAA